MEEEEEKEVQHMDKHAPRKAGTTGVLLKTWRGGPRLTVPVYHHCYSVPDCIVILLPTSPDPRHLTEARRSKKGL